MNTVEISEETAQVALREIDFLIKMTEDRDPDPLADDVFRASKDLKAALGVE
jgi:hypothetical protein